MDQSTAAPHPVTPTPAPDRTAATPPPAGSDKHSVYNLIILDESGSMGSIKSATIGGFNETLQTIQHAETQYTDQQHLVAFVPFSTIRPFGEFVLQTTDALTPLTGQTYQPNGGTPLYDAIGFSITQLSAAIGQRGGTYNVLVTILTDGEENSSRTYTRLQIKTMIETLKPLGWVFTYMGANHDVERAADDLAISHKMAFQASSVGVTEQMNTSNLSRMKLYAKMDISRRAGKILTDAEADYFADDTEAGKSKKS